jgi:hypothetical protein
VSAGLAAFLLAAGLVACTADGKPSSPGTQSSASSGAAVPVPGHHRGIPASAFAHHRAFSGPATKKFSQKALTAAYEEAVNYAFLTGWDPGLIVRPYSKLSLADLAIARGPLRGSSRAALDATFAGAASGQAAAVHQFEQLIFVGVTAPNGLVPATDGRIVLARKFTQASVGLDTAHGVQRLWVTFAARATIRMQDGGGHYYAVPTSRVLRYWMVPNPRTGPGTVPFLIDALAARMTRSTPTPSA